MAVSQVINAVAPQPSFIAPYSIYRYDQKLGYRDCDLGNVYKKEPDHRQNRSGSSSSRLLSDLSHRCYEACGGRQVHDETRMSQDPVGRRSDLTSSPDAKSANDRHIAGRDLPPIPSSDPSGSVHDAYNRDSPIPGISMRPTPPPSSTPPDQRAARPIGVENLLNPSAGGSASSSGQRQHIERLDSPRTVPMPALSRPVSPAVASISTRKGSLGEISLPSITPPLMTAYPSQGRTTTPRSPTRYGPGPLTSGLPSATIDARETPFVQPPGQVSTVSGQVPAPGGYASTAPSTLPPAYAPSVAPIHMSPHARHATQMAQFPRSQNLSNPQGGMGVGPFIASRSSSPSSVQHRPPTPSNGGHLGQPQSFFSGPFAGGPNATMPPSAFDKTASTGAGVSGQGQYPMMTLETESGPIQVPIDVQAASKVADEKRRRNATASHRFRQRRKEKEQETANNISSLEARVRELTDEKDFYQRERDVMQDVILRNRIPIPPRPTSPRRRRHASIAGSNVSQYQDPDTASREEGRNTRRRTSAYVPPQGPLPHAHVEPPPPMPRFERISALPTENLQASQQRMRPQDPYHARPHPYDPTTPH